jgi:hypothetical protein
MIFVIPAFEDVFKFRRDFRADALRHRVSKIFVVLVPDLRLAAVASTSSCRPGAVVKMQKHRIGCCCGAGVRRPGLQVVGRALMHFHGVRRRRAAGGGARLVGGASATPSSPRRPRRSEGRLHRSAPTSMQAPRLPVMVLQTCAITGTACSTPHRQGRRVHEDKWTRPSRACRA